MISAISGFFSRNGYVDVDAVAEIMPDGFNGTPEQFVYRVVSTFKLSDTFIEDHFERLNLRTLFMSNRVSETVLFCNIESIVDSMIEEIRLVDDDEDEELALITMLIEHRYSQPFYERIFGLLINKLENDEEYDPTESIWSLIGEILNGNVELFSIRFIMSHIVETKFSLLNVALVRGDMEDEVFQNLHKVQYRDLIKVMAKFESIDRDDLDRKIYGDVLTRDREQFVHEVMYRKIQIGRAHV